MISFTLTPSDYQRLQRLVAKRLNRDVGKLSPIFGLRVLTWFCIGLAGATYARLYQEWPELSTPLSLIGILISIAFLVAVAQPQLSHVLLRKYMLLPDGAFLSPQAVSFTASHVRVESRRGTLELAWSAVIDRDEDDANHYLFIDAMQALVIPRSALAHHAAKLESYLPHLKSER